jgi:hypothetical protein
MQEPLADATPLCPDRPLSDPAEDQLGHAQLAKMVAYTVLRGSPANGLVVGIHGDWGSGKTTVLNFIERYVREGASDREPVIVRFNPWLVSGREDILRRFFVEFERAALSKRVASSAGKLTNSGGSEKSDPYQVKQDLQRLLAQEQRRMVVLIDDVDRLAPQEMLDVIRLVKAVGDFPNVMYVLAFDRDVVTRALQEQLASSGRGYLEKAVQVPFDLPAAGKDALSRAFAAKIGATLGAVSEQLFDVSRGHTVFGEGVVALLRTPRDVARLANAVAVTYPAVRDEVNVVDFVAIEALRVFAPRVHAAIGAGKPRFVGMLAAGSHRRADSDAEARRFHEQWAQQAGTDAPVVQRIVGWLFPYVAPFVGDAVRAEVLEAHWRSWRRVCAEQYFDLYFKYDLGHDLSRRAYLEVLRGAADEKRTVASFQQWIGEEAFAGTSRMRRFLEMLLDDLRADFTLAPELIPALMRSIAVVGDDVIRMMPHEGAPAMHDDYLLVVVLRLLAKRMVAAERRVAVRELLDAAGPGTATRLVLQLGVQHGRHGARGRDRESEWVIETDAELDQIERHVCSRLRDMAAHGNLWACADLGGVLFNWQTLGDGDAMRASVADWLKRRENALELVSAIARMPRAQQSIDLDALAGIVSGLKDDGLIPADKLPQAELFLRQAEEEDAPSTQKP